MSIGRPEAVISPRWTIFCGKSLRISFTLTIQGRSTSFGRGIFLFLPWLSRLVVLPNGRVAADGSPWRMDDGRVVRDFKLEPTAREVQSRKALPRAVYWFERGGISI